jgi:hypothetical protein
MFHALEKFALVTLAIVIGQRAQPFQLSIDY